MAQVKTMWLGVLGQYQVTSLNLVENTESPSKFPGKPKSLTATRNDLVYTLSGQSTRTIDIAKAKEALRNAMTAASPTPSSELCPDASSPADQGDLSSPTDAGDDAEWNDFKKIQARTYASPEEEAKRRGIWKEKSQLINDHNQQYANGEVTYRMQINKFGDMSAEEVNAVLSGYDVSGDYSTVPRQPVEERKIVIDGIPATAFAAWLPENVPDATTKLVAAVPQDDHATQSKSSTRFQVRRPNFSRIGQVQQLGTLQNVLRSVSMQASQVIRSGLSQVGQYQGSGFPHGSQFLGLRPSQSGRFPSSGSSQGGQALGSPIDSNFSGSGSFGSDKRERQTATADKVAAAMDWRTRGAVTPVRDQGNCGSSWAFAAIGALEAASFIKTKKLVVLSEENLIDCCANCIDTKIDDKCMGGSFRKAFKHAKVHGINPLSAYPYNATHSTASDDLACKFDDGSALAKPTGHTILDAGDETAIQRVVGRIGPVALAIDASKTTFHHYAGGIYSDPECGTEKTDLTHAVLAVGYGRANGTDYWIMKNSYGPAWGDKGYFMIQRGGNQCGLAVLSAYPQTTTGFITTDNTDQDADFLAATMVGGDLS